jgi:homocysteine S-methyltransferase
VEPVTDPLADLVAGQGFVVLDGGLATALEARGHELPGPLWSARLLLDAPEEIRAVHLAWLQAGADCIVTAAYQATVEGLVAEGVSPADARAVLASSTRLALDARAAFLGGGSRPGSAPAQSAERPRPLVAASVGPYGAYLADGSEYDGRYGVPVESLVDFHGPRLSILAGSGPDLLALETIPSGREVTALLKLLEESTDLRGWLSVTCADGARLRDGTPVEEVAEQASACPSVCAVGVNCTEPRHVGPLVERMSSVSPLPILVYPNSGEVWDGRRKCWLPGPDGCTWMEGCAAAWRAGARILGGCCRTGLDDIATLRRAVEGGDWPS